MLASAHPGVSARNVSLAARTSSPRLPRDTEDRPSGRTDRGVAGNPRAPTEARAPRRHRRTRRRCGRDAPVERRQDTVDEKGWRPRGPPGARCGPPRTTATPRYHRRSRTVPPGLEQRKGDVSTRRRAHDAITSEVGNGSHGIIRFVPKRSRAKAWVLLALLLLVAVVGSVAYLVWRQTVPGSNFAHDGAALHRAEDAVHRGRRGSAGQRGPR